MVVRWNVGLAQMVEEAAGVRQQRHGRHQSFSELELFPIDVSTDKPTFFQCAKDADCGVII